jgi:hypothetical protein
MAGDKLSRLLFDKLRLVTEVKGKVPLRGSLLAERVAKVVKFGIAVSDGEEGIEEEEEEEEVEGEVMVFDSLMIVEEEEVDEGFTGHLTPRSKEEAKEEKEAEEEEVDLV